MQNKKRAEEIIEDLKYLIPLKKFEFLSIFISEF